MRKPTAKMIEVLRELAKPGVVAHYMRYMGRLNPTPYYFINPGGQSCTSAIVGLLNRGLVEAKYFRFGDHKVRISDAGRKWLEENP